MGCCPFQYSCFHIFEYDDNNADDDDDDDDDAVADPVRAAAAALLDDEAAAERSPRPPSLVSVVLVVSLSDLLRPSCCRRCRRSSFRTRSCSDERSSSNHSITCET